MIFVVLGPNYRWAFDAYITPAIDKYLALRGLVLNQKKTKLVTRENGFDFQGYNFQMVANNGKSWLRVVPSDKAMISFKVQVQAIFEKSTALSDLESILTQLNYLVNGWGSYHKYGNASIAFKLLDKYIWDSYLAWMKKRYPRSTYTHLNKIAFTQVGNVAQVPYCLLEDGQTLLTLKQLASIKVVNNLTELVKKDFREGASVDLDEDEIL